MMTLLLNAVMLNDAPEPSNAQGNWNETFALDTHALPATRTRSTANCFCWAIRLDARAFCEKTSVKLSVHKNSTMNKERTRKSSMESCPRIIKDYHATFFKSHATLE